VHESTWAASAGAGATSGSDRWARIRSRRFASSPIIRLAADVRHFARGACGNGTSSRRGEPRLEAASRMLCEAAWGRTTRRGLGGRASLFAVALIARGRRNGPGRTNVPDADRAHAEALAAHRGPACSEGRENRDSDAA
jgi:hypothetical protein